MLSKLPVTPYAGVWIEIGNVRIAGVGSFVTPYAGVWIEMRKTHDLQ